MTSNTAQYQSPFTSEMLDNFRRQGDALADDVIDAFAAQYKDSIAELAENLQNMIRMPVEDNVIEVLNKFFPDDEIIRHALEHYYNTATTLPEWVDSNKLKLGGHVFQDHLFTSFMVLGCASLPVCYVCSPDVKVLSFTRRLIDDAPKRLVETAQMVTDVMSTGGLTIKDGKLSGKGVQSLLKIRLIHAAIRHLLLHKEKLLAAHPHIDNIKPDNFLLTYVYDSLQDNARWYGKAKPDAWNVAKDGVPINAEALAETLLTFSCLILRGLKTIGVQLNKTQQDAFLHSWNIAGYILGVNQDFLKEFSNFQQADVIYQQIIKRRLGKTNDGALLQQSLLDVFSDNAARLMPFGKILHVRHIARLLTSKLVSKKVYTALGLKLTLYDRFVRFFLWLGIRFFALLVNLKITRPFADYMFGRISQSLWDWRADFNSKTETATDKNVQQHDKNGVCNPLIIPQELIASSQLSQSTRYETNT